MAYLGFHFGGGGGGIQFFFFLEKWGYLHGAWHGHALVRGLRGMLPYFFKWCNLVSFGVYFATIIKKKEL